MPKIVPVVEGDGEVEALPKLLDKILYQLGRPDIAVETPKNAFGEGNLTTPGGLENFVEIAQSEPDCIGVLVLIDADEKCAHQLAFAFGQRVRLCNPLCSVAIAVAVSEYEGWFLASLDNIAGKPWGARPGLPEGTLYPGNPEAKRGAKEWLGKQLPRGYNYRPRVDQPVLTEMLDVAVLRERSRSFRRLCHAVEEIVTAADSRSIVVTPVL